MKNFHHTYTNLPEDQWALFVFCYILLLSHNLEQYSVPTPQADAYIEFDDLILSMTEVDASTHVVLKTTAVEKYRPLIDLFQFQEADKENSYDPVFPNP